ncbi:methyltransferase family protein [Pandoraea terrigena]|uniref:Protein-s-isoprenylcysteine methyltransferase n=1 Tax=Pandoraea terrigena TaxID=2508292 RepID=A0A5E4UVG8_9BURK|nr:isoprenylcysteine carboxylmethyltransferase family protein [Pandoraea terrigena]VVE02470.1 protein-s-isoprenylcysteine methyltransferase [Pandoraea terrigena]
MDSKDYVDRSLERALSQATPRALSRTQWREMAVEVSVRLCCALLLSIFAYAAILQWRVAPERLTVLLLALASSLTVGLSLFARIPEKRDWRPLSIVLSVGGTFYFLAIELAPGIRLIPEQVGASLCCAGILWQLFAKASLRRSFGILPANRGIVTRGAYRLVRHPIYLGYFITDIGFLSTNFGWRNLLVYAGLFALQIGRLLREERLLSQDPGYRGYQAIVRYRIIPGVF